MALTAKHKLRYPVPGDSAAALATYFANLANDVDNKLEQRGMPYFGKNYIHSGAALTNPLGHNVNVALGTANINGVTFDFAASGNLTMTASTTNRIWLVVTFDDNGFLTGYTWSVRTDAVVPANSVLVGEVVEGAAAPTTMTPTFRGVIAPGGLVAEATQLTANSSGGGDKMSFSMVGDGRTSIELLFKAWHISNSVAANISVAVFDGPNGTGVGYYEQLASTGASVGENPNFMEVIVSPFVGLRTFYLNLGAGTGIPTLSAKPSAPANFRGRWAI